MAIAFLAAWHRRSVAFVTVPRAEPTLAQPLDTAFAYRLCVREALADEMFADSFEYTRRGDSPATCVGAVSINQPNGSKT